MSAETPCGFIGLGIMGRGMALNLLKKGFKVVVWNRSVDKCDELVEGQEPNSPQIYHALIFVYSLYMISIRHHDPTLQV